MRAGKSSHDDSRSALLSRPAGGAVLISSATNGVWCLPFEGQSKEGGMAV